MPFSVLNTLLRINMWQKLENNLYGKPVMVTGAVRVRKSTDISTLFRLLKTDQVVLKSLRRSSFKKGTVLCQSTLFLHCSAVLIYSSCSMKYLAEAKHIHPLNSGWRRKHISFHAQAWKNGLNIIENNTWEFAFVNHFNSVSLISLNECLLMCFSKHISWVYKASGINVHTHSETRD